MSTLTRSSQLVAGYDCIRHPCGKRGCGTQPGASHGICGDRWIYAVTDGRAALTLEVDSGDYPASVPASSVTRSQPEGSSLTIHSPFRLHDNEPDECSRIPAGKCYSDSWFSAARKMFADHGSPTYEQPEALWLALEAWFIECVAPRVAEAEAVDVVRQGALAKLTTEERAALGLGAA